MKSSMRMSVKKPIALLLSAAGCALMVPSAMAAEATNTGPAKTVSQEGPTTGTKPGGMTNKDWWPDKLDLTELRQHEAQDNPYGPDFDYAKEFATLDYAALKEDIRKALTTSQPWWPADYGHYGPFFIRMAWHSAGTYRQGDGRGGSDGGEQRFEALNSWPDNASLDKARRLLWPIKQKYGRKISWGDLMVLTGNVSLEDMGFKTVGFAAGREDAWQPDVVYWGDETKMLTDARHDAKGNLKGPLAATEMGLIYVNPEGPHGNPDPIAAAADIRRAFGRMAMNDEETLALIAGGHTFGKAHGARKAADCVAVEPAAAALENQGIGWNNKCGKGNAEDTITSGLEGAWSSTPTQFSMGFFKNLMGNEWEKHRGPGGAWQWKPVGTPTKLTPDAHLPGVNHAPMMFTTDVALKEDPAFRAIIERWMKDPKQFEDAFARAWFKLTHRDMGPRARYLGSEVPAEAYSWQDPLPAASFAAISDADAETLKGQIVATGLTTPELVRTAWASASTFRGTDMRGGANGGRLRLNPQRNWEVNNPAELNKVLAKLETVRKNFAKSGKQVSMADLIVLAGNAGIEQAAAKAGVSVKVPFTPGRVDATQEQTDVAAFNILEPEADGFRNYYKPTAFYNPTRALVDKADKLNLTVAEMTVLVGGMRALDANAGGSKAGVLTDRPGVLTNDFFTNLLTMNNVWSKTSNPAIYEGKDRASGKVRWTASPVDLVFGSNSELRAVAEVYASDDAKDKFVADFVKAWTKVMDADRF